MEKAAGAGARVIKAVASMQLPGGAATWRSTLTVNMNPSDCTGEWAALVGGHATPGMSDIQYKVPLNTNTNTNININTNTPRSTLCAYLNSEREIPGPTSGDQQRRKQAAPRAD